MIRKGNGIAKNISEVSVVKKKRAKSCLKCGHRVILGKGFFLCEACRKTNSHLEDLGSRYHLFEELRTFRLGDLAGINEIRQGAATP